MARTIGSKNKPKSKNTVKSINLNKYIENTPIILSENTPYPWVLYGKQNDFPNVLLNLFGNSVVHQSCATFIANAILGSGIDYDAMKIKGSEVMPNTMTTWDDFVYSIALDYCIFGAFSFQIVANKGKGYQFYYQPVSTVRLSKKDNKGYIKSAWISKDWKNTAMYQPIEIPLFNYYEEEEVKKGHPYLFYYSNFNPMDEYYGSPVYMSALDSIKASIKMQQYDYSSTLNVFTPSGILTLNRVDDEKDRQEILKNIEDTFSGVESANNIIVSFRTNNDDNPVSFTPISAPTDGVNLFKDTDERIINRIMSAWKIPSKGLIGIPMDSTGFSNEGSLLEVSYNLLEKVQVSNMRKTILNYINKSLKMNGIETEVIIKPLSFNLQGVQQTTSNTTDSTAIDTTDAETNDKLIIEDNNG